MYDTSDGKLATSLDDACISLKLHLYIDEFELCNPIGARRGKYTLKAVYFAIGDLPVRYRIKSNIIFLRLLLRHKVLKKYDPTYQTLFEPLLVCRSTPSL